MVRFIEFANGITPRGESKEMTFEELCEYFDAVEIGPTGGKCFVPGIFERQRPKAITALVVEFTRGDDPEPIRRHLADLRLRYINPTYLGESERPRFSVLIPFASPVPLVHPDVWVKLVYPKLIKHFNFERAEHHADPAHRYDFPRKLHKDIPHETHLGGEGSEFFRWQEVVGDVLQALPPPIDTKSPEDALLQSIAPPEIEAKPREQEDPAREADLKNLRGRLLSYASRSGRRMARGQVLTPLRDARSIAISWRHAMDALGSVAYGWEWTPKLLEVCNPSLERMAARGDRVTRDDLKEMLIAARARIPEALARAARETALVDAIERLTSSETPSESMIEPVNPDQAPADLH